MKKPLLILTNLIALLICPTLTASAQDSKPSGDPAPGHAQRIGVLGEKQLSLTLREAILMTLENNREIEIERLNGKKRGFDLQGARGAYDPKFSAGFYYEHQTTPVASYFAGGVDGKLTTTELAGNAELTQRIPWQGGTFRVDFEHGRQTSENLYNALDPQFNSSIKLDFTQPLLRNRTIDEPRHQIQIARRHMDLSDSQFKQRVIEIIASVESAYWDLVFARADQQIKRDSLGWAKTQLEHNLRQVEQGTLAAVDVVSARVEVERRTDEVEAATDSIQRAENALKALILAPGNADTWTSELVPTDKPELNTSNYPEFEEARKTALRNRPEIEQFHLKQEVSKFDINYFRDQTRPEINLVTGYGAFGLAGTRQNTLNPLWASQQLIYDRVGQLSSLSGLVPLPPFPAYSIPDQFIGGAGQSLNNLLQNDYHAWRAGVSISLPFGNRTAKADLGRALAEGRQIDAERERAEQAIEVEVRNALQAVGTTSRRVEAARNARVNAELQYDSEQRKFDAGLSTNFFVLDRQNALASARGRELKALTDYTKAVAELQRATSTTLAKNDLAFAIH